MSRTDLTDGDVVPAAADHLHLDALHQTLQLVPDVPGSPHGAELDEVLIAPLGGVAALHPLGTKQSGTQLRDRTSRTNSCLVHTSGLRSSTTETLNQTVQSKRIVLKNRVYVYGALTENSYLKINSHFYCYNDSTTKYCDKLPVHIVSSSGLSRLCPVWPVCS